MNEIIYQMTMNEAKHMLEEGLITEAEYREFEEEMIAEYEPVAGLLFSKVDLI